MIKYIDIKTPILKFNCPACNQNIEIIFDKNNYNNEFYVCEKCNTTFIIYFKIKAYKYLMTRKEQFYIKVVKEEE